MCQCCSKWTGHQWNSSSVLGLDSHLHHCPVHTVTHHQHRELHTVLCVCKIRYGANNDNIPLCY